MQHPRVSHENFGHFQIRVKNTQHVATGGQKDNVAAMSCVEMLRSFDWRLRLDTRICNAQETNQSAVTRSSSRREILPRLEQLRYIKNELKTIQQEALENNHSVCVVYIPWPGVEGLLFWLNLNISKLVYYKSNLFVCSHLSQNAHLSTCHS